MTAPAPSGVELTVRFLETCGVELRWEWGAYWFKDREKYGGHVVPDFTREEHLGRVVRMIRERWPLRTEFDVVLNHGDDPVAVRLWTDWSGDDRFFGHGESPGAALMRAAIAAGGGEGGLPEQGG